MDSLFTFRTPSPDPATTDNFATIVFDGIPGNPPTAGAPNPGITAPTSGPISANWKNTGANSIDTRVLGTNDRDATDAECDIVVAAGAIAPAGIRHLSINPALYAYYRFQHKATAGGSQGASKVTGAQHRV